MSQETWLHSLRGGAPRKKRPLPRKKKRPTSIMESLEKEEKMFSEVAQL